MRRSKEVSIVGRVLLVGGFVFGFGGPIIGMMHILNSVVESGGVSPVQLLHGLNSLLIGMLVGIPMSICGLYLWVGGAVGYIIDRQSDESETTQECV